MFVQLNTLIKFLAYVAALQILLTNWWRSTKGS